MGRKALKVVGGALAIGAGVMTGGTAGLLLGGAGLLSAGSGFSEKGKPPGLERPPSVSGGAPPVNFMEVFNEATGEKARFTIGEDGKRYINFSGGGKLNLDEPIKVSSLPPVDEAKGAELDLVEGATRALLGQKLMSAIESYNYILTQNPTSVIQNMPALTAFKEALDAQSARGLNVMEDNLYSVLSKRGLMNSSTAIGAATYILRQRIDSATKNQWAYTQYASQLKNDLLAGYGTEADIVQKGIGLENQSYNTKVNALLTQRAQDMDMSFKTKALNKEIEFRNEQMKYQAERDRRNDILSRSFPALASNNIATHAGLSVDALKADAGNVNDMNRLNLARYSITPPNPVGTLLQNVGTRMATQGIDNSLGLNAEQTKKVM